MMNKCMALLLALWSCQSPEQSTHLGATTSPPAVLRTANPAPAAAPTTPATEPEAERPTPLPEPNPDLRSIDSANRAYLAQHPLPDSLQGRLYLYHLEPEVVDSVVLIPANLRPDVEYSADVRQQLRQATQATAYQDGEHLRRALRFDEMASLMNLQVPHQAMLYDPNTHQPLGLVHLAGIDYYETQMESGYFYRYQGRKVKASYQRPHYLMPEQAGSKPQAVEAVEPLDTKNILAALYRTPNSNKHGHQWRIEGVQLTDPDTTLVLISEEHYEDGPYLNAILAADGREWKKSYGSDLSFATKDFVVSPWQYHGLPLIFATAFVPDTGHFWSIVYFSDGKHYQMTTPGWLPAPKN